ncbi:site-specific integrase [Amycolatopsis sp. NPDC051061]|uniref:tyrosine-type recombinase/integrase n=1 Tax=Amycolatopsis sp. NPDC051061 TaxID=3155042 RepID=UPI00343B48F1
MRTFYEFWLGEGVGLSNPVALARRGQRPHAHHNPLEPFRNEGKLRYNPKVPKRRPRMIEDDRWIELFGALRSNRDRAMLTLTVSSANRSAELLGVRGMDVDWGDQLVRVVRKGTTAEQWLPASPDAFVWIRLYVAELGEPLDPNEPLWWTLRRRDRGEGLRRQPVNYEALRAVLRRANVALGTNWTMHDLRHTAALRMARNSSLSMRDVQIILGHLHLSTTADIYLVEDEAEVIRRVHEHFTTRERQAREPTPPPSNGYDPADLTVLFSGGAG